MAELCVENLVMNHIRLARITRKEQLLFASKYPFNDPRMDRILRSRNSTEKAISRNLRGLKRFQENGELALGEPGSDLPGDSEKNGGPCPSPAVGPQSDGNTGGESALPDGSDDRPESGTDLWVESERVIFQGPPEVPESDSNDRVDAIGGTTSHIRSGKTNPTTNSAGLAKTGGPTKCENKPYDLIARIGYASIGLPYPYDEPVPSESAKTKPTGQSQAESKLSPHD